MRVTKVTQKFSGCICNPDYFNEHGFGTWVNQVLMKRPQHMKDVYSDFICVDTCLAKEVKWLWDLGITTTGNCCGHNIKDLNGNEGGYIGVIEDDIEKMIELGYKTSPGITPDRKDSFYPKTTSEVYNEMW